MKSGVMFNSIDVLKTLGLEVGEVQASLGMAPGCSYCGKAVENSTKTVGRGPLKRRVENEPVISPQTGKVVAFEEVTKFTSRKLVACPDCCLNLVGKTVFPEFD